MARQHGAVDGAARAGQAIRDETHLGRRATKAVEQKHARPAAGDVVALVVVGHSTLSRLE